MKKTLIVLCSAVALAFVGCDQNRGGMGEDSNRDSGYSRSSSAGENNSPSLSTNTNSVAPAPAESAPATPDQSSKDYNTTPKN